MESISVDFLEHTNNLTNYYYFKKGFTDEEIKELFNIVDKLSFEEGTVSGIVDKTYRRSNVKWIPYNNDTKKFYDKIIDLAKIANNEMWHFKITNIFDRLQFTEYDEKNSGYYDWHMDIGQCRASTRKLSVVVQLSEENEYSGGNLQFMIHRNILDAPKEKGTVIFFPSFITHRVTPIESGKRNSLVFWIHGPSYS